MKKTELEIIPFNSNAIRALSDEQLHAIVTRGIADWTYRRGAKEENKGKAFTLAEIASDLLETRSRDGEATDKDIKAATAWFNEMVKNTPDLNKQQDRIMSKVEINDDKFDTSCAEKLDFSQPILPQLALCWREWRLAISRQSKDI